MKHVKICSHWGYKTEPFSAFSIELYFGRNKNQRKTIPCKVTPDEKGILPEGEFTIIKTREKGTIMIVPGKDVTNRCLLMVGCSEGFRGSVSITKCDGEILSECYAGAACEGYISATVILKKDEQIVFHSTGRRTNNYVEYTFNGSDVIQKVYSAEEYTQANTVEEFDAI